MYGAVPPTAETVVVPFVPALQLTLVPVATHVNGAGSVMVALHVAVHPLASVTTTVYVPGIKPDAIDVVAPLFQR